MPKLERDTPKLKGLQKFVRSGEVIMVDSERGHKEITEDWLGTTEVSDAGFIQQFTSETYSIGGESGNCQSIGDPAAAREETARIINNITSKQVITLE